MTGPNSRELMATECCDHCREHNLTVRESARYHGQKAVASAERAMWFVRLAIGLAILSLVAVVISQILGA